MRLRSWILLLIVPLILVGLLLPRLRSRGENYPDPAVYALKKLGLALANFGDSHHKFVKAADTYGDDGKLCSWRVAILPLLDHSELFERYRFDQNWNSEENRTLLAEIPEDYVSPMDIRVRKYIPRENYCTNYLAVVGEETLWPINGTVSYDKIKDGASNTIMLVAVPLSVIPWTEPRDLSIDEAVRLFSSPESVGQLAYVNHFFFVEEIKLHLFRVTYADVHYGTIVCGLKPEIARALFTPNGGEVVDIYSEDSYQTRNRGKKESPRYYVKWDRIGWTAVALITAVIYLRKKFNRYSRLSERKALLRRNRIPEVSEADLSQDHIA